MDSSKAKRRARQTLSTGVWPGTAPKNKKRIFAEIPRFGGFFFASLASRDRRRRALV
jgi:hypothetical protein